MDRAPLIRTVAGGFSAMLTTGFGAGSSASAAVFSPPDLLPGSQYLLAFETSDTIFASSSAISDYNTFAMSEAAMNSALPATGWSALASTEAVSAVNNISCLPGCASLPVYNVDGTQIASSLKKLLKGNWDGGNAIESQSGDPTAGAYVWTGSTDGGTTAANAALGDPFTELGLDWQDLYQIDAGYYGVSVAGAKPIYALSDVQTIPGPPTTPTGTIPSPEPVGLSLFALGAGVTAAVGRLRRKVGKAAAKS